MWPFGPTWQAAAAFALIAALGIALSASFGQPDFTTSASDALDVLGLGDALDDGGLS